MSQFADDSMTPSPIAVKRDKFNNEIPSDSPMHGEGTPGVGSSNFGGNQYDDGPSKGGFSGYGKSVSGEGEAKRISVDISNEGA